MSRFLLVLALVTCPFLGCSETYPCGGPGPAAELVRGYSQRVQETLLSEPPGDDVPHDELTDRVMRAAGTAAAEQLKGHADELKARAAWRLRCHVPTGPLPDRSGWETLPVQASAEALAELRQKYGSDDLLRAVLWDPIRALYHFESAATGDRRSADGHAAFTTHYLTRSVAPSEVVAVSRDVDHPTLAFVGATEVFSMGLAWNEGGWYEPTKVTWHRKPTPAKTGD